MRYLYNQGRFKLYETEDSDESLKGTTGETYIQETILLFENVESETSIGKEIAWASSESAAVGLAEDISSGTKNIALDVQMILAEKIVEDKERIAAEERKKKTQQEGSASEREREGEGAPNPSPFDKR